MPDTLNGDGQHCTHQNGVHGEVFDSVDDAITAFAAGEFVVVVDNEDRENEGDLVIAAEKCTTEKMAFLIRYSSGYICCPATAQRLRDLELPLMVANSTDKYKTAYAISCDYRFGTTTGISAHDRALTCRKIADVTATKESFARPGHILPLICVDGGVMNRTGHTEASVDLCKLAGMQPAAVIGELMLDDGRMMRRDDCRTFARQHGLLMITIKDLVEYRRKHELCR
ncbi:MAG: 3,4-dihydroxy-2-butanone 4-phosphate synthase [Olpidium bornovanus]|uniref:3,4-dihydroxy-2-butanone 4-phosphate synthase n=1 Tax=Olpidium bornovanus TaxID=278681 RepID=A0A8H8DGR5_9FUNG|nr:MAG: 3,4-dihydroxy-2-butanone 4-phosphate synthase [Olpidium bornovanus]